MPYKNKKQQKKSQKEWYLKNKEEICRKARERKVELTEFVRNYKKREDVLCVDCGESRWQCIQFDHIDRKDKTDSISRMARRGMPAKRILEEISKCETVCANCHCIRHDGFQWKEDCTMAL